MERKPKEESKIRDDDAPKGAAEEEELVSSCESVNPPPGLKSLPMQLMEINKPEAAEEALQSGKWKKKRLVCISDTHSQHLDIKVPDGDILIHAGDFVTKEKKPERYDEFNQWIGNLPHPHKVVIAGNHEYLFKTMKIDEIQGILTNCIYLQDSGVEIDGLTFYGTPWNGSTGMAFGHPKPKLQEKWDQIPKRVDVLITHLPPKRILDLPVSKRHWGCPKLRKHVKHVIKPKLHVFGHVHEAYGAHRERKTVFINAATVPWPPLEDKSPVRDPIVIDLYYRTSKRKRTRGE